MCATSKPGAGADGAVLQRRPLTLAILGFGQVARALCELLAEGHGDGRDGRRPLRVVAAASRRRGVLVDQAGLAPSSLSGQPLDATWPAWPEGWDGIAFAAQVPADVLIELTTLDIAQGQPAVAHIEAALQCGKHVVTANKGPIAWDYARLRDLAITQGRQLLFEATVMDGAPVFSLKRHCLLGSQVTGVCGILNSTTNLVLDEMAAGRGFDEAVAVAQAMGIAEADASLDVDGHDATVKLCALANVLMDATLTPPEVVRQGIRGVTAEDVARTVSAGRRIKLIAQARREPDGGVRAGVGPAEIAGADPYAQVNGTSSILTISTDLLGELTLTEEAPGLRQTAYGVLRDLLELAAHA